MRRKFLPAIRPNVGISEAFRRKLDAEIRAMHDDIGRTIAQAYRANPPAIAMDASAANVLNDALYNLSHRWLKRFDWLAPQMGRHFAKAVADRSDAALKSSLRRGGFSVRFQLSPLQTDLMDAIVHENVALIRSIPAQHLTQVEGIVMRSVTAGRDLSIITRDLQEQFGVTRRRAALIATQQNNSATGKLQAVRQAELGLVVEWLHSSGDRVPRPTHKANSGKTYDPARGWYDPAEKRFILPGELIGCTCTSKVRVPGLS